MKFCHSCDAQIQESSHFCKECGARVDVDKPFVSTETSQTASQSFGDPSQRFGDPSQSLYKPPQGFGEQSQNTDKPAQSFGDPSQSLQQPSQSYSERPQNPEMKTEKQNSIEHHEMSNSLQSARQNNRQAQYPKQFESYTQQQRMYQQYQDNRQHHHDAQQILPEHARYKNLGGWMLFFTLAAVFGIFVNLVVSVRILNPIAMIWDFMHLFPEELSRAITIELIGGVVMLSIVILQIAFVVCVLRRNPIFLKVEQISYIILCLSQIALLVSANMAGMFGISEDAFAPVTTMVGAIIGTILMTVYYSKSVRVRVYMGSDDYKAKALFSFSRPPMWPY